MTPRQLKNSILQRAIEGRLVEQSSEEGTARELLAVIDKKNENIRPIKEDLNFSSMDFDIPDTWEWVELNRVLKFVDYRGKTPTKINSGVFLITASNIKDGYMDYSRKEYISEQEYSERQERGITEQGDILFTTEAPMGNCALNDLEKCSCGQRIITFKNYKKDIINLKLIMYFILSPAFQRELLDNCTGTTAKGIKAAKLKHFILPMPPRSEQDRIVASIEELLPLIDKYDKAYTKLTDFNTRFPDAMKKSLLQYAIQGKLVEQRNDEGTAQDLIKDIQAEKKRLIAEKKIKKPKALPPITEEEIPFDIPESWEWVRLGEIGDWGSGATPKRHHPEYYGGEIPWLKTGDLNDGYISEIPETITQEGFDNSSVRLNPVGSVLMAMYGATIGKLGILTIPATTNQACCACIPFAKLNPQYLFYYLMSQRANFIKLGEGGAQPNISKEKIVNFVFPMPPLTEQHRIVSKLEELLPCCDRLLK